MTLATYQQAPPLVQLYTVLRFGVRLVTQQEPGGLLKLYYLDGEPGFFAELRFDTVSERLTLLRSFTRAELPEEYLACALLPDEEA